MYKPLPACSCSASVEYEKERGEEKVHQFVMGLDESRFGGVCQGIISSDSLVDLGEAYAKVIREEQRLTSQRKENYNKVQLSLLLRKIQSILDHLVILLSALIAVVRDMKRLTSGNWLVFRIGGKNIRSTNQKTEDRKAIEDVVHQVLIEVVAMEQEHTTLTQLPLIHQTFHRLLISSGKPLLR